MRDYFKEFRKAEKLGASYVKDLFYVFLSDIESEKNVGEVNRLHNDITCCATFSNRKSKQIYEETEQDLLDWMREKCEFNDYGEVISFKGE